MTKFLDTAAINYAVQHLIDRAEKRIILISPYLRVNDRLKHSLEAINPKIDFWVVYGKNEVQSDAEWLHSLKSSQIRFCKNLHAKCYLNEREAVITSMNLYQFSQINNEEMGIYVVKKKDPELYADIVKAALRLIRISDEVKIPSVSKQNKKSIAAHCIRCNKSIAFNIDAPYCASCYKVWSKYSNQTYTESYCHICGQKTPSTMARPACYACYSNIPSR